jgi:hypothetical protein
MFDLGERSEHFAATSPCFPYSGLRGFDREAATGWPAISGARHFFQPGPESVKFLPFRIFRPLPL